MAARVTDADVKLIFNTSIDDTTPFINTANAMVNQYLVNKGLSDELLTQIECYLAAHLASLLDPRVESVKDDSYSVKVQGRTGLGLDSTFYGQNVKLLDSTGTLTRVGLKRGSIRFVTS